MMRRLFRIELSWALSRAFTKFGIAIAASNPMIATTIMISTSVKPAVLIVLICISNLSVYSDRMRREQGKRRVDYDFIILFTHCRLQPREQCVAEWVPRQSQQTHNHIVVRERLGKLMGCPKLCQNESTLSNLLARSL